MTVGNLLNWQLLNFAYKIDQVVGMNISIIKILNWTTIMVSKGFLLFSCVLATVTGTQSNSLLKYYVFQNLDFRSGRFHFLQNNFTYQIYQYFSWLERVNITF